MRVRFLKVARVELRDAVRYYDAQAGLGGDFLLVVTAAIERIAKFPAAWQRVDAELRMPTPQVSLRLGLSARRQ